MAQLAWSSPLVLLDFIFLQGHQSDLLLRATPRVSLHLLRLYIPNIATFQYNKLWLLVYKFWGSMNWSMTAFRHPLYFLEEICVCLCMPVCGCLSVCLCASKYALISSWSSSLCCAGIIETTHCFASLRVWIEPLCLAGSIGFARK